MSCVFCAADWEAKHGEPGETATMRKFRAPQGKMSDVPEATSSQERGSTSSVDVQSGQRNSRSLSMDEATRRSLEANRRVDDAQLQRKRSIDSQLTQVALALEQMPPNIIPTAARQMPRSPPLPAIPDCLD